MHPALQRFHPVVAGWFEERFGTPTEPQALGWPTIAAGRDTLIAAPTGSGKTLAAFLACIDRLIQEGLRANGALPDRTRIVYVSPLKALGNDIRKNLEEPLAGLKAAAASRWIRLPEIRTAVRSGDTTQGERAAMLRKPPHILITTPESLYLLLTAEKGREMLGDVRTVIVDEIHAVARDKRGAHLALSLERLARVTGTRPARIGLSATQRPIEEIARFLVGTSKVGADGMPDCAIVDAGHKREMDVAIEVPREELSAVASKELWQDTYDRLADLVRTHRSTLIFVNTRRLVERVTHALAERLEGEGTGNETGHQSGEVNGDQNRNRNGHGHGHREGRAGELVAAHHGSLSKSTRLRAETGLKDGTLKAVVATASLELGIDIGAVDLVCQIGSPRSLSVGLQRIGRAGHWKGAIPKGRIFPVTRDELVECAAFVRGVARGNLERTRIMDHPLDVLAQQIVAEAACDDLREDDLFDAYRNAWPYARLPRESFDDLVRMLSEGISTTRGARGAWLHRDGVHRRLRGRRAARMVAISSGGAIPDNFTYAVVKEPDGQVVGSLDEDFAVESLAGDIFLLGNTSWRIRRVEAGRVRVEDAQGAPPNIPFWLGEAPGRTAELSEEVSDLREAIEPMLDEPERAVRFLEADCGLPPAGAVQAATYLRLGRDTLGALPTQKKLIAERFFDEGGGMQLVVHAPFGARLNRAFGLALRKKFCAGFNFELQAAATDDGILLSLGPQHSFPLESVYEFLSAETVEETLRQAVLDAPVFGVRWRWNATRSLTLLRQMAGKRVPPTIQRMRSDDLLAAAFPDLAACQEHVERPIRIPDHPLVNETLRDCLHEAMDLEGLKALLGRIDRREIEVLAKDTPTPSPLSHEILNSNPYTYLDDAPLEERRARAVSTRRTLSEDDLAAFGALDPEAIASVAEEAWPDVRDADELHDALLGFGVLPAAEVEDGWRDWMESLVDTGRVSVLTKEGNCWYAAMERREIALAAVDLSWASVPAGTTGLESPPPAGRPAPRRHLLSLRSQWKRRGSGGGLRSDGEETSCAAVESLGLAPAPEPEFEEATATVVRGWLMCIGPTTVAALAARIALPERNVDLALLRLEAQGTVLRGRFSGPALPGGSDEAPLEWCDRDLLARIHRRCLARLRRELQPVTTAEFVRFLLRWQHVRKGSHLHGARGLAEVLGQLQGLQVPTGAWESEILPARIAGYKPEMLDELCAHGAVVWGRLWTKNGPDADGTASGASTRRSSPNRNTNLTLMLREDLPWLLEVSAPEERPSLGESATRLLELLDARGAMFFNELQAVTGRLRTDLDQALWELVASGEVTCDGFGGLRMLINPSRRREKARLLSRYSGSRRPPIGALGGGGRWSLLRPRARDSASDPSAPNGAKAAVGRMGETEELERLAEQYLRRWGVVFRDLLQREPATPPWRTLLAIYRRREARGEIRAGRFVDGFAGEQFALPEAVDALRAVRREAADTTDRVDLCAADPLNLTGILTPGPRIAATLNNRIAYVGGVPVPADSTPAPESTGELPLH